MYWDHKAIDWPVFLQIAIEAKVLRQKIDYELTIRRYFLLYARIKKEVFQEIAEQLDKQIATTVDDVKCLSQIL